MLDYGLELRKCPGHCLSQTTRAICQQVLSLNSRVHGLLNLCPDPGQEVLSQV
jgi:hypothetical protein